MHHEGGFVRVSGRARARDEATRTHHGGHAVFEHPLRRDLLELLLPELVVLDLRGLLQRVDDPRALALVLELEQARLQPALVAVSHGLEAGVHDALGGHLLRLRVPVHVLLLGLGREG